jgi:hypothetical protein
MTRTVPSATTDDTGTSVYLLRLSYWDGAVQQEVRLTDATVNISANVGGGPETWQGTGLLMNVAAVTEGSDLNIGGVQLTFDGVNQSIISIIMSNQFRNQPVEVYKAWFNPTTGVIVGSPLKLFVGYQNEPYSIGETSTDNPDAVSVTTKIISRVTKTTAENVVLSNVDSHYGYIQRSPLTDTAAEFFYFTPSIVGIDVHWGGKTLHPNAGGYINPNPGYPIPGSGAGAGPWGNY